jgi:asparagine synthase (glutamine-hydrolysing)
VLTLELTPYADTTWTWADHRYRTSDGAGEITPFPHPMVESLATTDGVRTLIVVRERIAGRPTAEPALRPVDAVS